MDACADESMYRFEEVLFLTHLECESIKKNFLRTFSRYLGKQITMKILSFQSQPETPSSNREKTPKTLSGNKSRKRKRLRENLAQLAAEGDVDSPMLNNKRRSNEIARVSFSASFLDATADTSGTPTG